MLRRILLAGALTLSACGSAQAAPDFAYLGQRQVPHAAMFDGTVIGGLSGISYDAATGLYYLVSDDRSAKNPARFYTARIALSDNGIDDVQFVSTRPWLDRDGRPFAPLDTAAQPPVVPPDPEGIAFDARRQRLYWTSEGSAVTTAPGWIPGCGSPDWTAGIWGVRSAAAAADVGQRARRTPEQCPGRPFLTPDGRHLWAAMEGPIFEDGASPDEQHGASTRITRYDVDTGVADAEYRYPLDPVSAGPGGDNGLSDLVALDDATFLVIERGYGTHTAVRIYRAGVIAGSSELSKTLLADLTTTPGLSPLDNIEGITLGPRLVDGRQSVILVSDDNFSPTQTTQFVLFAM